MAEACANCGRGDLLQADLANYQCLACGALTSIETGQIVPDNIPNVVTSPSGHPVIELGNVTPSFAGDEAGSADPEHRLRPGDPLPHPSPEVETVDPTPAPSTPSTESGAPTPTPDVTAASGTENSNPTSEAPITETGTDPSIPDPVGPTEPAPAPEPTPEPVPVAPAPAPIDLSVLSPEQVAAIELIAHPEGA